VAVRLAADYALHATEAGGLGLRRLLLRASAGNTASRQVATVAGFQQTGAEHAVSQLGDGSWADDVRYELLASTPA